MRHEKTSSMTAALVLLLSLLCACAAQHAQEMDENGYELYFLSDPNSAGGSDAIRAQEKRLTLDGAMETEDCVRALMEALLAGPDEPSLSSPSRRERRSSRSRCRAAARRST